MRITGGQNATLGQHSYQGLILASPSDSERYSPICSGSIINEQWVLTSATCLAGIGLNQKIQVKAAKYALRIDNEQVQTAVLLRRIHEDYVIGWNPNSSIRIL